MSFGGTAAASFTVDSPTQITAITPAHTLGTFDATVTTAAGTSATGSLSTTRRRIPPLKSRFTMPVLIWSGTFEA